MKKYFILKLDSYEGEGSSLTVDADGADSMYVVLNVEGSSAEIVDWGYPTVDDLLAAWDNVTFEKGVRSPSCKQANALASALRSTT